jgi:hypothetical protein
MRLGIAAGLALVLRVVLRPAFVVIYGAAAPASAAAS